jgi:hypothetical protein
MTENPATSTEEAAALMKLVSERRERVRELLQRGGTVDFFTIFFAHIVGSYLSEGDWKSGEGVLRASLAVAGGVMAVLYVRRRYNLGGRIELPTWLAAGAVFIASIAINIGFSGDRAGDFEFAAWGLGLLAIAVAYRKAALFLAGGTFAIIGFGDALGVPTLAWALVLAVYLLAVGYFGRVELLSRIRKTR